MIKDSGLAGGYDFVCLDPECYLDSSVSATVAAGAVTGLARHVSTTVDVILKTDSSYLGQFAVDAGGNLNLGTNDYDGQDIEIGYGYLAEIETLPIEDVQRIGSSMCSLRHLRNVFQAFHQCIYS